MDKSGLSVVIAMCCGDFNRLPRSTCSCQSQAQGSKPNEVFSWFGSFSPAWTKIVSGLAGSWSMACWNPVLMASAAAFKTWLWDHVFLFQGLWGSSAKCFNFTFKTGLYIMSLVNLIVSLINWFSFAVLFVLCFAMCVSTWWTLTLLWWIVFF